MRKSRRVQVPLAGGTSVSKSIVFDNQVTDNLFLHKEGEGAKYVETLHPTPGSRPRFTGGNGPCRSKRARFKGKAYFISGDKLCSVDLNLTVTEIGTLNTTKGWVSIVAGEDMIVIVDGLNGYTYDGTNFRVVDDPAGINLEGTVTLTNGAKTVSGVDTSFITDLQSGDEIWLIIAGYATAEVIDYVTDDTTAMLEANYGGATASDDATYLAANDFPACDNVTEVGGYFLVNKRGTNRSHYSYPRNGNRWPAASYFSAQAKTDYVLRPFEFRGDVYVFGEVSTESFLLNSQDIDNPFVRYPGGVFNWGLAAPASLADTEQAVFFLARNDEGEGQVMKAKDINPTRVSTPAIEREISNMAVISDAVGMCYQDEGHIFYVLTFPSAAKTLVYDDSTKEWHTRSSKGLGLHRMMGIMVIGREHFHGDYKTNQFYSFDHNYYYDNLDRIERTRRLVIIHSGDLILRHYALIIDAETGVGAVGEDSPQIALKVYNERTNVPQSTLYRDLGKIGETETRVPFRKLGSARHRVYDIVTNTANRILLGTVWLEVGEGKH